MIYRILTVLTPLITSPYLARALGVEALGKYSASQVFVNYFVPFAMLSIENYGNRTIARVQSDKKERTEIFGNSSILNEKPCRGYLHGSCSENAHRYEVSSRQRSMNGKDAKHYIAKLNSENYRVIFCHILMFIIMRK